jgi:hypothetical protein
VVPSGELDRLRETIEVFSDSDAMRDLQETALVICGREAIQALIDERVVREHPCPNHI